MPGLHVHTHARARAPVYVRERVCARTCRFHRLLRRRGFYIEGELSPSQWTENTLNYLFLTSSVFPRYAGLKSNVRNARGILSACEGWRADIGQYRARTRRYAKQIVGHKLPARNLVFNRDNPYYARSCRNAGRIKDRTSRLKSTAATRVFNSLIFLLRNSDGSSSIRSAREIKIEFASCAANKKKYQTNVIK